MSIRRLSEYITWCRIFGKSDADTKADWEGLVEYNKLCKERGMV